MSITASALRNDIYKILDEVLATGVPVEIERKGRTLRIIADTQSASKLDRIVKRPGMINGNPEDLVEIDWSANWNPEGAL